MNVNVEKLVTEIFTRECLWNQARPDHHNRYVLEKKWEEVSVVLNTTKEITKNKWKYLRDTFRKELAKIAKPKSGDAGGSTIESKWTYFKSLLFLKDQFTPRKSTTNLPSPSSCSNQILEETQEEEDTGSEISDNSNQRPLSARFEVDYDAQRDTDFPVTPQSSVTSGSVRSIVAESRKRKRPADFIGQSLLNLEKEKLKLLQNREKRPAAENALDEDRCFFESILLHVRNMDPLKKLQFRSKIQDLVMLYAYDHSLPSTQQQVPQINSNLNYAQAP